MPFTYSLLNLSLTSLFVSDVSPINLKLFMLSGIGTLLSSDCCICLIKSLSGLNMWYKCFLPLYLAPVLGIVYIAPPYEKGQQANISVNLAFLITSGSSLWSRTLLKLSFVHLNIFRFTISSNL